jgi:hypothetical protein
VGPSHRPFSASSSSTLRLGPARLPGTRARLSETAPARDLGWATSLRRSSRESATFGSGSVGQTTVVARSGTALRVELTGRVISLGRGRASGSGSPRGSPFCFRCSGGQERRALGALCIQPAAHLPILSADVHAKEILVFAVAILARQQMLNAHWCRGARQAARRCDRATTLRGLADCVRPPAHTGRLQLGPVFS